MTTEWTWWGSYCSNYAQIQASKEKQILLSIKNSELKKIWNSSCCPQGITNHKRYYRVTTVASERQCLNLCWHWIWIKSSPNVEISSVKCMLYSCWIMIKTSRTMSQQKLSFLDHVKPFLAQIVSPGLGSY